MLMKEGDDDRTFGVIVKGFVEVSIEGRVVCRLGPGEVVGEMAYLHRNRRGAGRASSRSNRQPSFEINPSALALSSEEVQGALPEGPHRPCARPAGAGRCRYRQHGARAVSADGGAAGSAPKGGSSTLELL